MQVDHDNGTFFCVVPSISLRRTAIKPHAAPLRAKKAFSEQRPPPLLFAPNSPRGHKNREPHIALFEKARKERNDSLFTKEKRDENVQFNMDARALLLSLKENWGALGYFLEKNVACLSNALWNLFYSSNNPESSIAPQKFPLARNSKSNLIPKSDRDLAPFHSGHFYKRFFPSISCLRYVRRLCLG